MLNNLISFPKQHTEQKFNVYDTGTIYDIGMTVRSIMQEAEDLKRQFIIICIGTDRSTGDALGPLTGSKLHAFNLSHNVFGTLDEPVHATNLGQVLNYVHISFNNPYILAVDACLGKLESVGFVTIGRGSVKPGAALNKELPPVGDAYLTGVVNVGGFMEHLVLQSTRLNLVMKMADTIAHGLLFGLCRK